MYKLLIDGRENLPTYCFAETMIANAKIMAEV